MVSAARSAFTLAQSLPALLWFMWYMRPRTAGFYTALLAAPAMGLALSALFATTPSRPYLILLTIPMLVIAGVDFKYHVGNKLVFGGMVGLCALGIIGALMAIVFHTGEVGPSILIAFWLIIMLVLTGLPLSEKALAWALPGVFLHAVITLVQGIALGAARAAGVALNCNIGAGILVIGTAYLATTRFRYWALPLVSALVFTGSRQGLAVLLVVLVLAGWRYSWRFMLSALCVVALTFFLHWHQVTTDFRISQPVQMDVVSRLEMPPSHSPATTHSSITGLFPRGYAGDNGLHDVPMRLWYELGAIGTALWVFLSGYGLLRHPWSPAWWILLAMMGLSVLDYYTWMPLSVSAFWWVAVKLQGEKGHAILFREKTSG
jgi:hypothetical protein